MIRAAVAFAALLVLGGPAQAHSWYDKDCCDEADCRPALPDEVKVVPQGFLVTVTLNGKTESHLFPKSDPHVRFSLDGRFHVCVADYGYSAPLSWYCLYIPGGGA